jgi:hypothetical protein
VPKSSTPRRPIAHYAIMFAKRPWLLIVALLGGFVCMWLAFLVIAHRNPPVMIEIPPTTSK